MWHEWGKNVIFYSSIEGNFFPFHNFYFYLLCCCYLCVRAHYDDGNDNDDDDDYEFTSNDAKLSMIWEINEGETCVWVDTQFMRERKGGRGWEW
jgi:hypothetical protein